MIFFHVWSNVIKIPEFPRRDVDKSVPSERYENLSTSVKKEKLRNFRALQIVYRVADLTLLVDGVVERRSPYAYHKAGNTSKLWSYFQWEFVVQIEFGGSGGRWVLTSSRFGCIEVWNSVRT